MANRQPKSGTVASKSHRLSMAAENYLLSIYRLVEEGITVTPVRLAEQLRRIPAGEGLGTSLPSVGAMIRRLVRESLVESTPGKDIVLTRKGRRSAEAMVRRHRLAERLVVDLLGLDLHKAHEEAHRLEHAISPELEEKIAQRLGNPTTCPFGAPIPGSGYSAAANTMPLADAKPGQDLVVDRVPEDDVPLLEYLVAARLVPGQSITVNEAAPHRGVMVMSCGDGEVILSYEVAARVRVRRS